jgi:hypothetical protein
MWSAPSLSANSVKRRKTRSEKDRSVAQTPPHSDIVLEVDGYSDFPSVILSAVKDQREAMRPHAVLQSSALWLSCTAMGDPL